MMSNKIILPETNWIGLLDLLKDIRLENDKRVGVNITFLQQLGYLSDDGSLSDKGNNICRLLLVRNDFDTINQIANKDLLQLPATQVLLQSLWGVKDVTIEQARMAFVFAGVTKMNVGSRLVNFLTILNSNKIIVYDRRNGKIRLLVSPKTTILPPHVYIDSSRPYSNHMWIRRILRDCRGSIMWLDKYFQKEALEWLWLEACAENIESIKIVSILGKNTDVLTLREYIRLSKELKSKGITLDWRELEHSKSHDFHDRWVLDENNICYNLPSVGTIHSGQKSEIHESPNHRQIKKVFEEYFNSAKPIGN